MTDTRLLAAEIIQEVLEGEGKSHLLLSGCFREHPELSGRDRGFITGLVHGTLENRILLDSRLTEISSVPVSSMKPWVRTVLRLGLFQLLFWDRVPAAAAVSESVALLKVKRLQGLKGFVNGVLRTAAAKTDWSPVSEQVRYSFPNRLWKRFLRDFGEEETLRLAEAFSQPAPLSVRVNLSKTEPAAAAKLFEAAGYRTELSPWLNSALLLERREGALPLEQTEPFLRGLVQAQDVSSMLAVALASPKPGDRVLDLCAAPGGKSLHAADLAGPEGSVLACDLTEEKTALLAQNIARSGFMNIRAEQADARVFRPAYGEAFDLVIADLPCSGLGVIGRKPEIKYRVREEDIAALAVLQREILENALRYVKPGGRLLFSTCTLTREENFDNAAWLAAQPGFSPVPLRNALPEVLADRLNGENCLQLLPGGGSDGFFISVWERKQP